jgi:hypothetical protein
LGYSANRYVAEANARSIEDAITQLADAALKKFPESEFAAISGGSPRTDRSNKTPRKVDMILWTYGHAC